MQQVRKPKQSNAWESKAFIELTEALAEKNTETEYSAEQGGMHVDFEWDGNHGVLRQIEDDENIQMVPPITTATSSG